VAYHDNQDSYFKILKNRQRDEYYRRPYRPVVVFDGLELQQGGSGNPNDVNIYNRYKAAYLRRTNVPSPVQFTGMAAVDMMASPRRANLVIKIEALSPLSGPGPLKVRFVLYEDDIQFRAVNGQTHFDWVVRDILEEGNLTITQPQESMLFTRSVELKPEWVDRNMAIAVFVQRDPPGNKEVLGAADFRLHTEN
jgi:hypothetical protein